MTRRSYIPPVLVWALCVALTLVVWAVPLAAQGGQTQKYSVNVYTAKFLCGPFARSGSVNPPAEGPVVPGEYQTAINVHNPNHYGICFRKKAVLMFEGDAPVQPDPDRMEEPKPPAPFINLCLPPNWGMEIDCPDIRMKLLGLPAGGPPFIKGVVVLETFGVGPIDWNPPYPPIYDPLQLDVIEVITGDGYDVAPDGTVHKEGFSVATREVRHKNMPITAKEWKEFWAQGPGPTN